MRSEFERIVCGPGAHGLYESNYLKANEPAGQGAFWIKYNLMAPADQALPRTAELWAIYWSGAGSRPIVVQQVLARDIRTSRVQVDIATPAASLCAARAAGSLESDGHRIAWDLDLEGEGPPIFHAPYEAMYRLPVPSKKLMTPRPRLTFTGWLEVDGARIEVARWVGLRGHNWGSDHPVTYAYCNANLWEEPGDWAFDGFSGRIRLGPALSPWLSAAVLRLARDELAWNGLAGLVNKTARAEFPSWSCAFGRGAATLRVHARLDPEEVAGLRYLSPSGRVSYCYNTKFGVLEVTLGRAGRREERLSRFAELEFLVPEPIPGIPLHGAERLGA
jgi:hypothetical protein